MDKGIRPEARRVFAEYNARRVAGEYGTDSKANTKFRKDVMSYLVTQFNITVASAATHYNEAFKFVKSQNAESVKGLGRAEDKKGGRKKKVQAEAAAPVTTEGTQEAAPVEAPAEATVAAAAPAVRLYTVKRAKDGTVVAENLTEEQATELVERAARAKKARLIAE